MKNNILLIGGSSDIGKNFIKSSKFNKEYDLISTSSKNLDLSNESSIENFIFKNRNKKISHIIFLSALNNIKKFENLKDDEIEKTYKINFLSFIYILKKIINNNKSLESIIIISSLYGLYGRKGRFIYSTSKHLLNGLIKTLCIDLSEIKVRVNGISPGFIKTKMTNKNLSKIQIKKINSQIPVGRLGNCKEIVNVMDFLLSKESYYINGQNIIVDGGFSVGGFFD